MPTPYQVFYGEIPTILRGGPKTHREIAQEIQDRFPEYCDDSILCPHVNDTSNHPEWDHHARNAEQALKRNGIIKYNYSLRVWELA